MEGSLSSCLRSLSSWLRSPKEWGWNNRSIQIAVVYPIRVVVINRFNSDEAHVITCRLNWRDPALCSSYKEADITHSKRHRGLKLRPSIWKDEFVICATPCLLEWADHDREQLIIVGWRTVPSWIIDIQWARRVRLAAYTILGVGIWWNYLMLFTLDAVNVIVLDTAVARQATLEWDLNIFWV